MLYIWFKYGKFQQCKNQLLITKKIQDDVTILVLLKRITSSESKMILIVQLFSHSSSVSVSTLVNIGT